MPEKESQEAWSDEQKWNYLVRHERLGELLVRQGKLTLGQLETALTEQEKSKKPKHLGEIIVDKKFLTKEEIISALDKQAQIHQTSEQTIQKLKQKDRE